jgi:hypothetical protein
MKTNSHFRQALAPAFAIGLIILGGAASGQTFYYQNAGSNANAAQGGGTYGGTLGSIGFDESQYNRAGSTSLDSGLNGTRVDPPGPGAAYDLNFTASGLVAPAGTELSSVTLYLYADTVNLPGAPVNFSIYDGIGAARGNFVSFLTLDNATAEGGFFAVTIPGSVFLGGFSITSDGLPASHSLTVASELNTDDGGIYTPGLSATFTPIPEPSVSMLGALASLALLRRRRA